MRAEGGKASYVKGLFDAIAPTYDLMNLIMTAGMLRRWQRVFAAETGLERGDRALDVCCGTGELALIMALQVGEEGAVEGVDFSERMLEVGRRKVRARRLSNVTLRFGDALNLPYADDSFDCAAIGFALRNVADIERCLAEMARVVRPGGRVISLEISRPESPLVRLPFQLYFYHLVPLMGLFTRGGRRGLSLKPYAYLPRSLTHFPGKDGLAQIFEQVGLRDVHYHSLSGGVVAVHVGTVRG